MKKALLSLSVIFTSMVAVTNAQEAAVSKWPASPVLPEPHDWSIGFDVVPILSSVGNLFHSSSGNDTSFSQQQFTIVGLRVKDDRTAYRMRVRIGYSSNAQYNLVQDDASATSTLQIADEKKITNLNVTLGAGIQKWIGKGRLRGIYGGEVVFMLSSSDYTYNYGNPLTSTGATITNWTAGATNGVYPTISGATTDTSEYKPGTTFGLGINGFIGAEYFFAPKMSFSAEYKWGFMYTSTGEGAITQQYWNTSASTPGPASNTFSTGNSSSFNLDVQNAASIVFHLYF